MPGLDRKQAEEEMTAALEEYALDPWCGIMKNSKKMAEAPVASGMIETDNLFFAPQHLPTGAACQPSTVGI